MRGADLLADLAFFSGPAARRSLQALGGLELAGVTADSRRVAPGFLFAALPGGRADGRSFIAEAVARGAVAVLAPCGTAWPAGVPPRPLIEDAAPRRRLAEFAARFAGPQPRCIAAVTGTNGKTSTAAFLRQLWAAGGHAAASVGTLGLEVDGPAQIPDQAIPDPANRDAPAQDPSIRDTLVQDPPISDMPTPRTPTRDTPIGATPIPGALIHDALIRDTLIQDAGGASLTTPDPVALADMLARLARAGIARVAMEASSHGLAQFRLDGVQLAAAGFTNLTRDHLDYHGTEDAYRTAKLRLFAELLPAGAPVVAGADMDRVTFAALREIAARRKLDLRTVGAAGTTLRLCAAHPRPDGQDLEVVRPDGVRRVMSLSLPGRFQAENALLAVALAEALGEDDALSRLPGLRGVRGRLELAARLTNGAAAYVDYAHTPDALARVLAALRPHAAGRLVVVFGAGGDRDRGKRPLMGAAAAAGADVAIVTDDNPRSEDPAAIRAAIRAACPGAREIGDREAAIAAGLDLLTRGDVLVVAGKGHEAGQIVGDTVIPFDDAAVIRRLAGIGP